MMANECIQLTTDALDSLVSNGWTLVGGPYTSESNCTDVCSEIPPSETAWYCMRSPSDSANPGDFCIELTAEQVVSYQLGGWTKLSGPYDTSGDCTMVCGQQTGTDCDESIPMVLGVPSEFSISSSTTIWYKLATNASTHYTLYYTADSGSGESITVYTGETCAELTSVGTSDVPGQCFQISGGYTVDGFIFLKFDSGTGGDYSLTLAIGTCPP